MDKENIKRHWMCWVNACPADTLLSGKRRPLTGSALLLSRTEGAFLWVPKKKRKKWQGLPGIVYVFRQHNGGLADKASPPSRCLFKLDKILHPFDALGLSGYLLSFVPLCCGIDRTGQHDLALKRLH